MSRLKKLALLSIVLFMISPIFICLYSTLIFGNSFLEQQWWSAIALSFVGAFLLLVIDGEMK